MSFIDTKSPYN